MKREWINTILRDNFDIQKEIKSKKIAIDIDIFKPSSGNKYFYIKT